MDKGVDGQDIFIDDIDRKYFLAVLSRITSECGAAVIAYCLMSNHFHLAIKVSAVSLATVMQRILTHYAITFNLRHGRTGHLFQARYTAKLCADDAYLVALIRYIHMNPVRAGLVMAPEDWEWSSYRLFKADGRDGLVPTEGDLPDFDPWPSMQNAPILIRPLPETKQELSCFAAAASRRTSISVDELRSGSRRRDVVAVKKRFVQLAVRGGHRLGAIAAWLGLTSNALSRYVRENTAHKCKPDTGNCGIGS